MPYAGDCEIHNLSDLTRLDQAGTITPIDWPEPLRTLHDLPESLRALDLGAQWSAGEVLPPIDSDVVFAGFAPTLPVFNREIRSIWSRQEQLRGERLRSFALGRRFRQGNLVLLPQAVPQEEYFEGDDDGDDHSMPALSPPGWEDGVGPLRAQWSGPLKCFRKPIAVDNRRRQQ